MPRVREIAMDGLALKISPFTWDQVETYLKEGQELAAKEPKATLEEWTARTLNTVVIGLNNAVNGSGGEKWTQKKLTSELDRVTILKLHKEFIELSGLEIPKQGEDTAASTSR